MLESVYYVSVVLLEVPTGYLSDITSRKMTLLMGAISLVLACVLYLSGTTFVMLAIGQVIFALHMSLISGTNTVFHYESLAALKMNEQYGDREAVVHKYGSIAGGTAALLGGWLSSYQLTYAYYISLLAGIAAVIIASQFVEPETVQDDQKSSMSVLDQFKKTLGFLKEAPLGWLACYFVLVYAITHVPYEFYQPYIQLLDQSDLIYGLSVSVLSGLIYASARYVSAIGASYSMVWSRRLGLFNFLMIALVAITAVVFIMASGLNIIALGFVLLRSTPWMAIKAPINNIITPRIGSGQRATFHSMLSLICRLSFFIVLLLLSLLIDAYEEVSWQNLQLILMACVAGAVCLLIPIYIKGRGLFSTNS